MDTDVDKKNDLLKAELKKFFRPEFINRLDEIVSFHRLSKEEIKQIVHLQLSKLAKIARTKDVELEFTTELVDYLAEHGYEPEFGARPLKRLIETSVINPLSLRELEEPLRGKCVVDLIDGEVKVFQATENPIELKSPHLH